MKRHIILTALFGLSLSACATSAPERLEDVQARALQACPAAVKRSQAAGDYSYGEDTCDCIAGRITVPLWSDANSSYTGDPMPVKDAQAIERGIAKGETLKLGLEAARAKISVPSANSVNTCFAKY